MESISVSDSAASTETSERLVMLLAHNRAEQELCRNAILSQSHLYGVETVTTAEEALTKLQSGRFDVIVMDYELPDNSDGELVQTLHKAVPHCPIIVITSVDSPDLALKILLSGASDYLPKITEYQKFLPRSITTNLQRAMLLENLRETYQRVEQSSKDEALLNRLIIFLKAMASLISKLLDSGC